MSSIKFSDSLSPMALKQYVHQFEDKYFEVWETVLFTSEQNLDAVERNKDHQIVLQQELKRLHPPPLHISNVKIAISNYGINFKLVGDNARENVNYDDAIVPFSSKIREVLTADDVSWTAFAKGVGELWQDLPKNKKTFYLAQSAEHQITKRYKSYAQYEELTRQELINVKLGGTLALLNSTEMGKAMIHSFQKNARLRTQANAFRRLWLTLDFGPSRLEELLTQVPKTSLQAFICDDVSYGPILKSSLSQVDVEVASKDPEEIKRITEVADEVDSTPAVKHAVEALRDKLLRAQKRTRNGCLTCRRRKVRCDEERPSCGNCIKATYHCAGYTTRSALKDFLFSCRGQKWPHAHDSPLPSGPLRYEHSWSFLKKASPEPFDSIPTATAFVFSGLDSRMDYVDTRRPNVGIKPNMELIMSEVVGGFSSGATAASLTMNWDFLAFMDNQYVNGRNADLGSVITLSGTAQNAQATTCLEYVKYNWPSRSSRVIRAFQSAIDSHRRTGKAASSDEEMTVVFKGGLCTLVVQSHDPVIIAEILQQAVWMGTALRTSSNERVQYSNFHINQPKTRYESFCATFTVRIFTSELLKEEQSCWFPLFANPVIARGFPVSERENQEQGLEVPLEMMAALGGARHVTEFEGGLVLKGYSTMFVPVKCQQDSVQWHLILARGEDRILYCEASVQCPNRALLEELNYEKLSTTRTFLGWWKSAETHLGTADAGYKCIDWSPLGESKRSAKISGANLGFQNMLTGQLSFVLGAKDGRLHFSQKGPFQRIVQCAEKTPVVLYDTADYRAWLVPGLDLMLHVVQTRHHLSPYQINGNPVELTPAIPKKGRAAAAEAVASNQQRQLYERDFPTRKPYCFQDAILDIWSQMERLMEKEDSIEASAGLALHGTMQSKLHGWEYMSLVDEKNYRRKEATVSKSSGGWVDLINDVDCLVLFATGLGEIIRPVTDLRSLCSTWKTLPKKKDYLAAGVPMMELLYSEAGSRLSRKHLSTSHLQWDRGSMLFEPCSDRTSSRCKCDRTQQIYHDSLLKTLGHVRAPGVLEENGCVVFGQAYHSFKPRKSVDVRQKPLYTLPNTQIEVERTAMQSSTKVDCLSPLSSPGSVSPKLEEVNGYVPQKSKRSRSPLSFIDDIGYYSCGDETPPSEDNTPYPTEHHSILNPGKRPRKPEVMSPQTMCASEDEYEPQRARKHLRRQT